MDTQKQTWLGDRVFLVFSNILGLPLAPSWTNPPSTLRSNEGQVCQVAGEVENNDSGPFVKMATMPHLLVPTERRPDKDKLWLENFKV